MKKQAEELVMEFYTILGGENSSLDGKINVMEVAKRCARRAIMFSKKYATFSDTITLRKIGEEIDKLDF